MTQEKWIKAFFESEFEESFDFVEYKENDRALLSLTVLDSQASKKHKGDFLSFEFTGHNLSLFEEKKDNTVSFQNSEELHKLKDLFIKAKTVLRSQVTHKFLKASNKNIKSINYDLPIEASELNSLEGIYDQLSDLHQEEELYKYVNENIDNIEVKSIYEMTQSDLSSSLYLLSESTMSFMILPDKMDQYTMSIYTFLAQMLEKFKVTSENLKGNYFDHIFLNLPYAIAIYDNEKEIYTHNSEFSKLGLTTRELGSLKNNQSLDIENLGKYKVLVESIDDDYTKVSFVLIDNFSLDFSNQSQEELGIVSSSIAHELNNPLGGILAALDVLLLDELEDELSEKFLQMKEGVFRCKELVETFLAFSRKKQEIINDGQSFEDILNQVSRLARFRLIESNYQIKLDFNQRSKLSVTYNSHLLTMVIYLFFGEILTRSSKESLIQNKNSSILAISIYENKNYIDFELENGLKLSSEFLKSKLFNHILDLLSITIDSKSSTVRFNFN